MKLPIKAWCSECGLEEYLDDNEPLLVCSEKKHFAMPKAIIIHDAESLEALVRKVASMSEGTYTTNDIVVELKKRGML